VSGGSKKGQRQPTLPERSVALSSSQRGSRSAPEFFPLPVTGAPRIFIGMKTDYLKTMRRSIALDKALSSGKFRSIRHFAEEHKVDLDTVKQDVQMLRTLGHVLTFFAGPIPVRILEFLADET